MRLPLHIHVRLCRLIKYGDPVSIVELLKCLDAALKSFCISNRVCVKLIIGPAR